MKRALWFVVVLATLLASATAWAHKPSDSYLTLELENETVKGRWDIALRDLANALPLDADGDGKVTWGEVEARRPEIVTYALAHLALTSGGKTCPLNAEDAVAVTPHSDGTYFVMRFAARCDAKVDTLNVDYRLFFDLDAQHRGILRFEGGTSQTHIFSTGDRTSSFDLAGVTSKKQLSNIIGQGVIHIWKGYDHILFLLALLLPAVVRRKDGEWEPVDRLRPALMDVLRIVTAFTVAHSITLSLAALGVVTLPSRVVESVIALSVVLAAVNNIYPILREDRWAAAFLLGLMHGFGFSSTLMDLDLPRANLVLTLFGFNLGVEIGQVAVVAIFVPLTFAVRKTVAYRRWGILVGSIVIGVLATIWLIERMFEVRVIS